MRRNLPLAAVMLFGLVAGAGIAWLVKSATASPARLRPVQHATAPLPQPEPSIPAVDQPVVAPVAVPRSDAETHPFPGTATLAGLARFEDGTPCAVLPLVVAHVPAGGLSGVNVGQLTHDERVAYFERQGAPATAPRVQTDAEGRFELEGVTEGDYILISNDPRRVLVPRVARGKTGTEIQLVVRRQMMVQFEFVLESGERLESAYFMLYNAGETVAAGYDWRPGKHYRVTPGPCKATVMGGPHSLWKAEHEFDVPVDGLDQPVRITLTGMNALIVNRIEPSPFYGKLGTLVISADTLKEPITDRTLQQHLRSWGADRNSDPYVVKDLAPGRYVVHWVFGPAAVFASAEVEYRGGIQEFTHAMPELRAEDHFPLRVLGPQGEAVAGATVDVSMQGGFSQIYPCADRGEGEYWIRRIPARNYYFNDSGSFGDEYIISVKSEHGQAVVRCSVDNSQEVIVRLGHRCRLTVLVDNIPPDANEYNLVVVPAADDVQQALEIGGSLAARRTFTLSSGPMLLVVARRVDHTPCIVIWQEVDLRDAEQQVRIDMGLVRTLRVVVPPGLKSITLRAGDVTDTRNVDEGRPVEFAAIGPGLISLDAESGTMDVTLPVDGDVHFLPQPYNALVATFPYGDAVLTRAGFEPGDVLRQINGVALAGTSAETFAPFHAAAEAGDVNVQLTRRGRSVALIVSAQHWTDLKSYFFAARRILE